MGDSRINTNWNELMGRSDIVRIYGEQIENLTLKINCIKNIKPKICLVMIGIHDMFWLKTPEQTFEDYKLLINKLKSDDYKIVIQSLIYVCPVKLFFREQNQEVDTTNALLKDYAINHGLIYFDINTSLSKNNALNTDYSSDGVHINPAGFELWKSKLTPLLNDLKL
jgi:lysophospholipase L1-like esterase